MDLNHNVCYQVFLRSGHLVVYEICPAAYTADAEASARTTILLVKFVKSASRTFEIQRPEEGGKTILAEQKRVQRLLIPFTTSPTESTTLSGVFFTGDRPCWILATDKGGVQIHPSGHAVVHAFTACSLWESKGDFLMYTDEVRKYLVNHLIRLLLMEASIRDLVYWSGCRTWTSAPRCRLDISHAPGRIRTSRLTLRRGL